MPAAPGQPRDGSPAPSRASRSGSMVSRSRPAPSSAACPASGATSRARPSRPRVATVPAHRYAAATRDQRGLAFMAPGFFEAEWLDGDLHVTLLRSVGQLSRNDLDTRSGSRRVAHAHARSRSASAGPPSPSRWRPSSPSRPFPALWEDAFVPLQPVWLRDATGLAEPGRQHRARGRRARPLHHQARRGRRWHRDPLLQRHRRTRCMAPFASARPRARAVRVRADEQEPVAVHLEHAGRALSFTAGPHAWVTFVAWHT